MSEGGAASGGSESVPPAVAVKVLLACQGVRLLQDSPLDLLSDGALCLCAAGGRPAA